MDAVTIEDLTEFLRVYYRSEIAELAQHYPKEQQSLYIDYQDLYRFDMGIADDILVEPDEIRQRLKDALLNYDLPIDIDLSRANIRITNLPKPLDVSEASRKDNIGHLLDVTGQVSKVSKVKPRINQAVYNCLRCGTRTTVPQFGERLQEPHECSGCERKGPYQLDQRASDWTNHQYARLQQPPERTRGGNAQDIDVHVEGDLIEEFDAGDRITLTGILEIEEPGKDQLRVFDTTISAEAVQLEETTYEDIDISEHLDEIKEIANGEYGDPYHLLVDSINPKHQGDEDVKLAIALQLFGGWAHEYPDGSRDRGDSHVLLLGDPGCGKSTFLQAVDNIAPRSTYASGQGASASGMTAAAVKDNFGDSQWSLEAGALVLADQGVACIDEIDKVDDKAVSSMHDALEGQQVHVNKAGIEATLNARSAVLAAGNPKEGRFDRFQPMGQQIDLTPTLLSRFDLMFMVSDQPDPERDSEVVEHMIHSRRAAGSFTKGEELDDEDRQRIEPAIDREVLRAYIAHAKDTCFPVLEDEEVQRSLRDYFVNFRANGMDEDSPVPVTFRKVEGIQRLAEASARIRLSEEVTSEDVKRAIKLVEKSMRQVGYDRETDSFDADIIETGRSASQRERYVQLRDIVKELDGAPMEEIIETAVNEGMDEDKTKHEFQQMKDQGKVYLAGDEFRWS